MKDIPSIFIDTSVLRHAVYARYAAIARKQTFNWGGATVTGVVHESVALYPQVNVHSNLSEEINIIPYIAWMAHMGKINLFWSQESKIEYSGVKHGVEKTWFDDIDIKVCEAPIRYARVEMAAFESTDVLQYEFLKSLLGNHPKFLAISKMTGAYQGSKALNRNQLVDAFYIWCAESSNLDFLLSTDMKLVRHVNNNHSSSLNVKVVTPIALLMHLQDASGIKIFNVFRWIIWMRKKVKLKSYGGAWGLVHASKKLRKRGYYDE